MSQEPGDSAAVRVPPPLIFFACLAAGALLEYLFPTPRINGTGALRLTAGMLCSLGSLLMAAGASFTMIRHRTPFNPDRPVSTLVTNGVFRFSRNPMYLSLLLLQLAVAALYNAGWVLAFVPVLFLLLHLFAIRPEEAYLEDKFGDTYRNYRKAVRRWI